MQARQPHRWSKGQLEARVAWTTAGAAAALDVIVFAPDAPIAEHVHQGAWECLLPLRAAGDVVIDGKPKKISPGVATCIAPDIEHAWKPGGSEPLVAIQFYAPVGDEQRFKALAEAEGRGAADPVKTAAPAP